MGLPFRPDPFLRRFAPLRRLRERPLLAYLVAVTAVAAAASIRIALAPWLAGVPLLPFYPAIAIATATGGSRPGMVALLLSVVTANFMLHAPDLGFVLDTISLFQTMLFALVSALIVAPIILLNEAVERLYTQADNSVALIESQPTGIIAVDDQGIITHVNAAIERQLGYRREELIDQPVELLVPHEVRLEHRRSRDAFIGEPSQRLMGAGRDLNALAKDGSQLPVEIGLSPIIQGGRQGVLATIVDISERKNLERRSQMLANEVQHRSRNLLTVVQALAYRMLPKSEGRHFNEVLAALARTHALFGTATTGSLRAIIDAELAPFRGQCDIGVSDLLVTAKAGQDITLIIHELATNAVKHGALSTPEGRVSVTGEFAGESFRFSWTETGGPKVAKPHRAGLGKTILEEVPEGFGAEVSIDYPESGVRYLLVTPLNRLSNVTLHPVAETVSA